MKKKEIAPRFGIGEWYGRSFVTLSRQERSDYSKVRAPSSQECLPRSTGAKRVSCNKKGGVCLMRLYAKDPQTGLVTAQPTFCTMCPERFLEGRMIFEWVGKTILGCSQPLVTNQVGFLVRGSWEEEAPADVHLKGAESSGGPVDKHEDVGQIDSILVDPDTSLLRWCALEIQSVYFSGEAMSKEYATIRRMADNRIPFPQKSRRPDYRSSGPKRLMPQLQIKVPTLRRWGKKMAVVIDKGFFDSLGTMREVPDISNCDIVWFIVDYREHDGKIELVQHGIRRTTLESAVEGLTAGVPVSLPTFEDRLRSKLAGPKKRRKSRKKGSQESK